MSIEGIWTEKPTHYTYRGFHYHQGDTDYDAYSKEAIDAWLEKLKAYYAVTTNSIQVYEWKEKAEKYDKIVQNMDSPLQLTAKYIEIEDTLEAVREFVLSRRDDIEKDIEDFGMLKPVLNYFLEEGV